MLNLTAAPPVEEINARSYRRAHIGRLMIVERKEGRELAASDFFHIADVATHPTGLLVTGIFQNARRSHMMATAVREANAEETAWRAAQRGIDQPEESFPTR